MVTALVVTLIAAVVLAIVWTVTYRAVVRDIQVTRARKYLHTRENARRRKQLSRGIIHLNTFILIIMLWPSASFAQVSRAQSIDCIGRPDHLYGVSAADDSTHGTKAYGPMVPTDEVWLIDAASISTTGWNVQAPNVEWALEVIEPVPDFGGLPTAENPEGPACCWRIAVAKQVGAQATPVIALGRSIVLRPNERLAGRHNQDGHPITLLGTYWRFPVACASSLIIR